MNNPLLRVLTIVLVTTLFFIDIYLKYLSSSLYMSESPVIPASLFGKWISFSYAQNSDIAFSLPFLRGKAIIFFLLAIIIAVFCRTIKEKKDYRTFFLYLTLFLGAVSNLMDRIKYGYVIDYIDLKYFAVFNIADAMIVVSTLGIIFMVTRQKLSG